MKKDHPIFVQYLSKYVWKSYNYCSFLDKNSHVDVYSILNVCDFYTIENSGYNNRSIFVQYMSNNIFIENSGYNNHSIFVQYMSNNIFIENSDTIIVQYSFNIFPIIFLLKI